MDDVIHLCTKKRIFYPKKFLMCLCVVLFSFSSLFFFLGKMGTIYIITICTCIFKVSEKDGFIVEIFLYSTRL